MQRLPRDPPFAVTLATELTAQGKPIDLRTAASFLQLMAMRQTDACDRWACRWYVRWLSETPLPTIDAAAEIAGALEELPMGPVAPMETVQYAVR
jgi:hypothetical protein